MKKDEDKKNRTTANGAPRPARAADIKKSELIASVGGRRLSSSLEAHEMACIVLLAQEQAKPNADNALIGVLCDSVRLVREFCDFVEGIQEIRGGR